jgi:hypothetical protein
MDHGRVAFGLAATTVALKARTGQLRLQDQVDFAIRALEFVPNDDMARLAVVDFLTHVRRDPAGAGARLQDFILAWSEGEIQPQDPQLVLAGILSSAPPANVVPFVSSRISA